MLDLNIFKISHGPSNKLLQISKIIALFGFGSKLFFNAENIDVITLCEVKTKAIYFKYLLLTV